MKTPGQRIRAARKAAGLTQEALAARLNVSKGAISQWEKDVITERNERVLFLLGDVLGVSSRWLALGDSPPGKPAHLNPDEAALIDAFRHLSHAAQEELISRANEYRRISGSREPSRSNPYPHKK